MIDWLSQSIEIMTHMTPYVTLSEVNFNPADVCEIKLQETAQIVSSQNSHTVIVMLYLGDRGV